MIQQGLDYKVTEGNSKMDLPNQHTLAVKKKKTTALRDLQNDNQKMATSSFLKYPAADSNRVSGVKRPSSDCLQQSPGTSNGHLVYVRRKSESELGRITPSANPNINNSYCPHSSSRQLCCEEQPVHAPFPMASSITSSRNPSLPISLDKSTMPLDSNYVTASSSPTAANPNGLQNVHWEDRYQQLHMFLRNLDISHQEEYIQMLRSLSSVELSRHAVELEKRSIQLSLEEARELQRVRVLNVLEKPVKNFKAPADHEECSDKLKTPS